MSRWRAERMGTASHYENGKTIERLQRAFDGIERPAPKRPQTRAERRRLQRERDIEDAYMPDTSMQDVTAERDKDAGRTFSHRHGKEMSLREQREAAARLIDCPDVINRAGLYDTITLRDSDGEEYERELDFPETKTPPIFNAFRGDYVGAVHSIGGYTYQFVKVKKANGRVYALGAIERDGKQGEKRFALMRRQRKKESKRPGMIVIGASLCNIAWTGMYHAKSVTTTLNRQYPKGARICPLLIYHPSRRRETIVSSAITASASGTSFYSAQIGMSLQNRAVDAATSGKLHRRFAASWSRW